MFLRPCFLVPSLAYAAAISTANLVVPILQDAVVPPAQDIPAVSVSIDDLKAAWQLKHRNVTAGTPAYWAKRAADRDVLFPVSQTVSVIILLIRMTVVWKRCL
jgi:hypothetical protein